MQKLDKRHAIHNFIRTKSCDEGRIRLFNGLAYALFYYAFLFVNFRSYAIMNETNNLIPMSLPELLSYSTVQIRTMSATGPGAGTGFIVNFCNSPTNFYPMLISNKHVLDGAVRMSLEFSVRGTNGMPMHEKYQYDTSLRDITVIRHPVEDDDGDVCAIPIGQVYNMAAASGKTLMTYPLRICDVGHDPLACASAPLSQLIMIGYPAGMRDVLNNQPIFRTGIAATNPRLDYNGKKVFFVDMAVFPGSSGSPVILYNDGTIISPYNNSIVIDGQPRYVLLGILAQQYRMTDSVNYNDTNIANNPILSASVNVPLNIGLVIKTERLLELQRLFFDGLDCH